jgi:hypothetical protein
MIPQLNKLILTYFQAYCSKGKVCIGLKKTNHHKIDVDIPVRENFDFSEALDSVYPLTEMIFSYLDYKSLQTVGQVKKSWQITANNILEKRNKVSWITVFRKKRLCYVHDSDNYHNHNTAASIILFNCSVISLSDSLCCHENLTQKKIKCKKQCMCADIVINWPDSFRLYFKSSSTAWDRLLYHGMLRSGIPAFEKNCI